MSFDEHNFCIPLGDFVWNMRSPRTAQDLYPKIQILINLTCVWDGSKLHVTTVVNNISNKFVDLVWGGGLDVIVMAIDEVSVISYHWLHLMLWKYSVVPTVIPRLLFPSQGQVQYQVSAKILLEKTIRATSPYLQRQAFQLCSWPAYQLTRLATYQLDSLAAWQLGSLLRIWLQLWYNS